MYTGTRKVLSYQPTDAIQEKNKKTPVSGQKQDSEKVQVAAKTYNTCI